MESPLVVNSKYAIGKITPCMVLMLGGVPKCFVGVLEPYSGGSRGKMKQVFVINSSSISRHLLPLYNIGYKIWLSVIVFEIQGILIFILLILHKFDPPENQRHSIGTPFSFQYVIKLVNRTMCAKIQVWHLVFSP